MSTEQGGGTPGPGAMSERLRALLSRAAEEQLLEQRQVSSVLGELRTLVEDVDERLATGEQVEHVAAQVRALSARVDARLDAADARSAELAERIGDATALLGQAAQDLAGAVAAQVAERVEAQLREVLVGVGDTVGSSERRLATHVDDAVLALAEVVLRRRRSVAPAPAPAESQPLVAATPGPKAAREPDPVDEPVGEPTVDAPERVAAEQPSEHAEAAAPAEDVAERPAGEPTPEQLPDGPPSEPPPEDLVRPTPHDPAPVVAALPEAAPTSGLDGSAGPSPGDGFVLVPADVEVPDAAPVGPVEHERRTADRRTTGRGDGSGRRRRPWWRPA